MRTRWVLLPVAMALMGSTPGVANAEEGTVTVDVARKATLIEDGAYANVPVAVSCPPFGHVLEAFILLEQDGVSGQGGIPGLVCDGQTRPYTARVQATDPGFQPGRAHASGFVLLCDDVGTCIQGQESDKIRLKAAKKKG